MTEVELVVPYGKEGVLADIRKNVHVLSESYEEKGVCLKVKANPGTLTALKQRLASQELPQWRPALRAALGILASSNWSAAFDRNLQCCPSRVWDASGSGREFVGDPEQRQVCIARDPLAIVRG